MTDLSIGHDSRIESVTLGADNNKLSLSNEMIDLQGLATTPGMGFHTLVFYCEGCYTPLPLRENQAAGWAEEGAMAQQSEQVNSQTPTTIRTVIHSR